MRLKQYLAEQTLNVAKIPLSKGKAYAEKQFSGAGKNLDTELPDFDKNYQALQDIYKKHALNVKRIDMPVIEPTDMKAFDTKLKSGKIDIFKPTTLGKAEFPTTFGKDLPAGTWLKLGQKDGDKDDDKINAKWTNMAANKLKPIQSQVWLEKLVKNIVKFGKAKKGSPITETTIIVSKEGYILDGHHRHGQAILAQPNLKLKALLIPLNIDILLKMGRSYGTAIGNKQKA